MILTISQLHKCYPNLNNELDNIKEPLKIIFLDIDGVLNSELFFIKRAEEKQKYDSIDRNLVLKLNALKGCVIVVSSSWGYNKDTIKTLKSHGLSLPIISGISPIHTDYGYRGIAIQNWLEAFCKNRKYEYVIIDDDDDMTPMQMSHFVQTDSYTGITDNNIKQIKTILNIKN